MVSIRNALYRVDDKERVMLRFLQGNGFNYEKTMKSLDEHLEWRLANLPVDSSDVEDHANNGLLYFFGRDIRFRPILHIPVKKIADANVNPVLHTIASQRILDQTRNFYDGIRTQKPGGSREGRKHDRSNQHVRNRGVVNADHSAEKYCTNDAEQLSCQAI